MSSLPVLFTLLILSLAIPLPAKAQPSVEALLAEQFSVQFKIGPRGQATNISFESSEGEKYRARFSDQSELSIIDAETGQLLWGKFQFNKLSGTDLGSGRVYSGTGTLMFDKVHKPNGEPVGCPPLCERSIKLSVDLQPMR